MRCADLDRSFCTTGEIVEKFEKMMMDASVDSSVEFLLEIRNFILLRVIFENGARAGV